ncbi:PucR family transcriptional regulator ligand-binding domain-containing protein [uncultured Marinobacter sp.]|uniref:PucR family transcriptional regulator n=1 Tax=uncultured Marinobacter sp. TaxID=187379 RepID=UPI0030DB7DA9|tara:strand:- start:3470 stop:4117 length:648 start_codon:yes stop_codon:yes gene_type:complete
MPLRCRDIPKLPGLESIKLRGGSTATNNPVRWPYVAENRSFRDWVKGGELVFVTGISRHRSPQNLAECLYEGKECGISGVIVLTGEAYIGQLPNTLSRLADKLSMPLFEQPYSLPMVEVTESIGRAIVWSEHSGEQTAELELASRSSELLDAWIGCRGNQRAMADVLSCHRNTVHKRMNQLTDALPSHTNGHQGFKTLLLAHLLMQPKQHRRTHD